MTSMTLANVRALEAREPLALSLTLIRAPLGAGIAATILFGDLPAAAALLVAFVIIDIADGAVARARCGDDALRRACDSVIDRSSVFFCFAAAAVHHPTFAPTVFLVGVASLLLLKTAYRNYRRLGLVLRAPASHRIWSLGLFASGLLYCARIDEASVALSVVSSSAMMVCTAQLRLWHGRLAHRVHSW